MLFVDSWPKAPGTVTFPSDAPCICRYPVHVGIDSIEEEAYLGSGAGEDELWVQDQFSSGLAVRDNLHETLVESATHLLRFLFLARDGHRWPTHFLSDSSPSLIDQPQFEPLVQALEAGLRETSDQTTAEAAEVVSLATELNLDARADPAEPGNRNARCPETGHWLYLSNGSTNFSCGYCMQGGGPVALAELVSMPRGSQAASASGLPAEGAGAPTDDHDLDFVSGETMHVLLSEAGECEAGVTEFHERVVHDERLVEQAFTEMEEACEQFIESQTAIIASNEGARKHNESMYGSVDGGYFYYVYWLAFPRPPSSLTTAHQLMAYYFGDSDLDVSRISSYLRCQTGHDSDDDAISALMDRYAEGE